MKTSPSPTLGFKAISVIGTYSFMTGKTNLTRGLTDFSFAARLRRRVVTGKSRRHGAVLVIFALIHQSALSFA